MSTLPPKCQRLLIPGYVLGNLSLAEAVLFDEMLAANSDLQKRVNIIQQALDNYTSKERERLLISGYVLGNLSPDEAVLFDEMLAANSDLQERVNIIQQALNIDNEYTDRSEQSLISGYVLGNLSPDEAVLFDEMLAANPDLQQQIVAMQEALDLAYNPVEISPPPALRDRLMAAANARSTDLETEKPPVDNAEVPTTQKFKISGSKILGAIALAVITTLGIANYRLWQTVQTAKTNNDRSDRLTYLLRGKDANQNSTAKLVVDRDRLNATLTVDNLPSLPPEKVYALWTVVGKDVPYTTDDKGAILTVVFQVNESGNFTQEIAVPQPHLEPRTISKIAITIEDIFAPQVHQGSIFISTGD